MNKTIDSKLSAHKVAGLPDLCMSGFNDLSIKLFNKTRNEIIGEKDFKFTLRQLLNVIPKRTSRAIVTGCSTVITEDKEAEIIYSRAVDIGVFIERMEDCWELKIKGSNTKLLASHNVYNLCIDMWDEEDLSLEYDSSEEQFEER